MGTQTKKAQPKTHDFDLTPRGVVSGVGLGVIGESLTAGVGQVSHLPCVWGAGLGIVGAFAHLAVSLRGALEPSQLAYRLGCWGFTGGWLGYNMYGDHVLSNTGSLASLAIGAVAAGILAKPMNEVNKQQKMSKYLVPYQAGRAAAAPQDHEEWQARLRRVYPKISIQVLEIVPWENRYGYDVHCRLYGGASRTMVENGAEQLAIDADLPIGCGVEFADGRSRAQFVIRVSTENRLAVSIPFPEDLRPRSIYDNFTLGECRNGDPATINLREDSAVIVGQKRSGKTNTLDVITAWIGLCFDALPLHIDLNGGGASQLWLRPWLEGLTERPAIDWAAPTPMEALYLSEVLLRIAKHRKSAYAAFKAATNDKLLQLSAQLPALIAMVDEGAEAMGLAANNEPVLRKLKENLEQIQRIAGNEGVNVLPTGLAATSEVISPRVLAQCAVRVGMRMQDKAELAYLFGWKGLDPADLPAGDDGKGAGFFSTGTTMPRPFKVYFLDPSQISRMAIAIANARPELDAESARIADERFEIDLQDGSDPIIVENLYSNRYKRMREYFGAVANGEEPPDTAPAPAPPAQPQRPGPTSPARLHSVPPPNAMDASTWPDFSAPAIPPKSAADPMDASTWPTFAGPRPTTPAPASLGRGSDPQPAAPVQPVPELVTRAIAAFDEARDDRMHSETLAAALGIATPYMLSKLLAAVKIQSLPNKFFRGGVERRGYAREAFEVAADRIARGEIDVPDEVAEWPAA